MVSKPRSYQLVETERVNSIISGERIEKELDVAIDLLRGLLDELDQIHIQSNLKESWDRKIFTWPKIYRVMLDLEEMISPHFHIIGSTWK